MWEWEWEWARREGARETERRAPGPGTRREHLAGAGWWRLPGDSAAGAGGLGTGECGIWGLETREAAPEEVLAARTLAFLRYWQMGGNPSASALLGGDSDGLEGWEGPKGQEGRLGRLRPSGETVNTRLLGTCRGHPLGPGTTAGERGFDGRSRLGRGEHPARLPGRGQPSSGGPGIRAASGGGDRRSSFEEEEIQKSAGPGVRACVWGWEVRVVSRARARAASV